MIYGHQFCLFMQIAKRGEDEAKMNEPGARVRARAGTKRGEGGGLGRGVQQKPEGKSFVQKCKVKQTNRTESKEDRSQRRPHKIHTASTDAEGQSEVSIVDYLAAFCELLTSILIVIAKC